MPNENPRLRNNVQGGVTPSAESSAVGMTRTEFAKRVGAAVLLAAASLLPAPAVAGCIGEEFTVGKGTGGSGGETPTAGATSSANSGTGGKETVGSTGGSGGENVGGQGGAGTGGMENTGGQGGTGGVNVGGQGGTGGVNVGGQGGAGTGGTGGINNVGGGGAGGTGGGPECLDNTVKINNMAEYVLRVYRGGCDEANAVFSSYVDGSPTFNTGTIDLCLEAGDVPIVQVKDAADNHSVEFESGVAPMEVERRKISSGTPASYAEMNGFCAASSGYTLVTDVNPAATGYKYEGNPAVDPSNGYRIEY